MGSIDLSAVGRESSPEVLWMTPFGSWAATSLVHKVALV
jgi:hypothetical protein